MLSSCDYWPHPGCLSLSDQWDPLCVLAWVLCVCTCACVHSCLNLGYCSTLLFDSVLTIIRLYCASWSELHPGKKKIVKKKKRLQAPQVGMHSFGRLSSQMHPELFPQTFIWDFIWKDSRLSSGKMLARKRGEPNASMSSASAHPCALCVVLLACLQLD